MDATTTPGARIFVSYAHEDEELKDELDKHLKVLKRSAKVEVWSDRDISSGQEWNDAIVSELQQADIILLLVSVDFNASDFIWEEELSVAMQRHEQGTAKVVPVFLRECDWDDMPYAKINGLPRHAKPVTTYENRDAAYTEVAQGIEELVDKMHHPPTGDS